MPRMFSNQSARAIQGGQHGSNRRTGCVAGPRRNLRVGDLRTYAVGAWGKICARQTCRYEGQNAAHGQITERNTSVAQARILFLLHEGGRAGDSRNRRSSISSRPYRAESVPWVAIPGFRPLLRTSPGAIFRPSLREGAAAHSSAIADFSISASARAERRIK
jgi:hypothetical protein